MTAEFTPRLKSVVKFVPDPAVSWTPEIVDLPVSHEPVPIAGSTVLVKITCCGVTTTPP